MKRSFFTAAFAFLALMCIRAESAGEGQPSLVVEIRERVKTQFNSPILLEQLPVDGPEGKKYRDGARAALLKKYPATKPEDIVRIIWPAEGWRISRDEFTAMVKDRYCVALVLVRSDSSDEYWVVKAPFFQQARGLFRCRYGETYVRSLWSVDRIKKMDADKK